MPKKQNPISFEELLSSNDLAKLTAVFQYKGSKGLVDTLRGFIASEYGDMFEQSAQMTLREFFMNYIDMLNEHNISYGGYFLFPGKVTAIKNGELKANIVGFTNTCKHHDALIINYRICTDETVPKYDVMNKAMTTAKSTVVYFETTAGDFVYISAINTIKTLESFNLYMQRLKYLKRCA